MATERTYNIPLRKEWLKTPKYKRAKKAVTAIKEFLVKHMKSDNIKLGKLLNLDLWKHGIKNPPHHIKVTAIKEDDGTVKAELFGKKYEEFKKIEKVEKTKKDELMEKLGVKAAPKEEDKKEEKPAEKTESPKEDKPQPAKDEKPAEEAVKKEEKKEAPKETPKKEEKPKPAPKKQ